MTAVIEIDNLQKTYGGRFGQKVTALRGVTFSVDRGEIFGLLGPNGAGKTTLVKVLLGIVRRYQGTARLMGFRAGDRRGRRRVGYLPENLTVPGHHTALSAMMLYGQLSGLSRREVRAKRMRLLELVGLQDRARDSVKKYSKGMRQRLGVAQVLLHDPEVIFLDEPTDGLDPVGRADVRKLLKQLSDEGRTVFLNSHLLQEVEMVCDRVAILHLGDLKRTGTVAELGDMAVDRLQLKLVLRGQPSRIQQALEAMKLSTELTMQGEDEAMWQGLVDDQSKLDQLVDRLRRSEVSILEISRRRASLEDAFMQLINAKSAPGNVASVTNLWQLERDSG